MTPTTTIAGTVLNADGRPARGQVVISWPFFQVPGQEFVGGETTYKIVDGQMSLALQSNQDAQPLGMYYTATFELDSGQVYEEYWIVPNKTSVTMGQCRVSVPDSPSVIISPLQLGSLGALPNQFLQWNGTRWVPGYASSLNFSPITIGLLLGSTGNDVNVAGSPASLGGNLQLNIPDASPTARGVITTGAQTLAGDKTFTGTTTVSDLVITGNVSPPPGGFPVTWSYGGPVFGYVVGQRPIVNFYPGSSNVAINMTDDPVNNQMLIEIDATGGGGGGGGMIDPTLTVGDLIVRGPLATERLPRGSDGQILTAVSTTLSSVGVGWVNASSLQTPWLSNIDGAGHSLSNVGSIHVEGVNFSGILVGQSAGPGSLDLLGDTCSPSGGCNNISSNAYWDGSAWNLRNPGYEAWLLSMGSYNNIGSFGVLHSNSGTLAWSDYIRVTSIGRVGLGTSTPQSLLHIFQPTALGYQLIWQAGSSPGTYGVALDSMNGDFLFDEVGVLNRLRVQQGTGNVGIGTGMSPAARLQINVSNAWVPSGVGVAGMGVVTTGSFGGGFGMVDTGHSNNTLALWSNGGHLNFGFGDINSPFTERMVLTRAGTLGIGVDYSQVVDMLTVAGLGQNGYGQIRMVYPSGPYGAFFRNDGNTFFLMSTGPNDQYGTWKGPFGLMQDLATNDVGIGATAPGVPLNVQGSYGTDALHIQGPDPNVYLTFKPIDASLFQIFYWQNGVGYRGIQSLSPVVIGDTVPHDQFCVKGRSTFGVTNEPFAVQLNYNDSTAVTFVGTNVSGDFQVSTQGGAALLTLSQSGWGATINGNCNINNGQYLVNGVPLANYAGPTNFGAPGRAANAAYQNGTGKPMFVTVSVYFTQPGVTATAYCYTDWPPSFPVALAGVPSSYSYQHAALSFVVLPGWNYMVSGSGFSIEHWSEWY